MKKFRCDFVSLFPPHCASTELNVRLRFCSMDGSGESLRSFELANNFPVLHVCQSNVLESNEFSSIFETKGFSPFAHVDIRAHRCAAHFPGTQSSPGGRRFPINLFERFRYYTKTIHSVGIASRPPKYDAIVHEVGIKLKIHPKYRVGDVGSRVFQYN